MNPYISRIINGRMLSATGDLLEETVSLGIAGERVAEINRAPDSAVAGDGVLDARGALILPGFIDLSCNLREPGNGQKGNIQSETLAAAHGGFTTVCASPDTSPVNDSGAVTHLIRDTARVRSGIRVLPLGAATRSLEGELLSDMVGLKTAGCVAFSNGSQPLANARILRRCMAYAQTFGLTLMLQPVNQALAADGYAHDGPVAARLGLLGVPEVAETAAVMEMLLLAEETGVRLHLGQLSCGRSVAMIAEAKARGVAVTADVAMHQLMFTDEALSGFDSRYHVVPPLRSEADRRALLAGVESGIIDAIVSQHRPDDSASKLAPVGVTAAGMSTVESVFSIGLMLVQRGELSLAALVRGLTRGPAAVLGLNSGLDVGALADFSVWNLDEVWLATPEALRSRGQHVPIAAAPLAGVNHHTVCGGRLAWSRG